MNRVTPVSVCVDFEGNIIFSDKNNFIISKLINGKITILADIGPHFISIDNQGNMITLEEYKIKKIS
jgi:hypothetical protein